MSSMHLEKAFAQVLQGTQCSVVLTPTSSTVTVKPGSSFTLTCTVSGYSLTDRSYASHWIRQFPGKTMEWLGVIWYEASTDYHDSVKDRITISKSGNSFSLQMRSLTTADTAVYYCARGSQ
ncbi:HV333 protein, partial [Polypterus senegalus]